MRIPQLLSISGERRARVAVLGRLGTVFTDLGGSVWVGFLLSRMRFLVLALTAS